MRNVFGYAVVGRRLRVNQLYQFYSMAIGGGQCDWNALVKKDQVNFNRIVTPF